MRPVFARLLAVAGLLVAAAVPAQDYRYHLYVDRDVNAATGCTVVHGPTTVSGVEARLTAEVSGTTVTLVSGADCSGGSFGASSAVGGPHAVGLNNGTAGADVVELSAPRSLFGGGGVVRIAAVAENAAATTSDGLTTLAGGGPILLGLSQVAIPTLGFAGLLLLIAAVFVVARRRLRLGMATLGALLMAGAVWAANFISDGAVGDWAGVSALASDPTGDGSGPDVGADVVALFAAEENGRVFARIDVVDVENQAPVAASQAQTWLEDAPTQTLTLTATDADGDPLTFAIQTPPTRGVLGAIVPINATSASVSYTPNANEFGADSFSFVANDGLTNSAPATVAITLTPVNDVPAFTAGANVTVLKDTGAQTINPWATAISAGPANESAQTLTFTITANDNPGMFAVAPAVAASGALSFTTAANANGTANLSVRVQDNGGTANGGVDTSATQNFSISLTAVNDAPSFTKGADQTVLEDAGAQTVNPWASAISAGPPDEAGQTLTFNITGNTNAALFSAGPAVSAAGVLTYTPAANANGTATITLALQDNGGTANGGVDTSAPQTFVINVTAVNDVPVFTVQTPVTVAEDAGAQTATVATAIGPGAADESGQTLAFTVTSNDNAGLFSVQPSVSAAGIVSFTAAANASGVANLGLRLQDDGGVANGGVDTSAIQNFTINVTAVDDPPVAANLTPPALNEDSAGTITLSYSDVEGDLATSCALSAPSNVSVSTPCACAAGVCTVGVTGSPDYSGAAGFSYTVTALQLSNTATASFTINAVNDAPVNSVPATQTTGVSVALALNSGNGNAVAIADVDAGAGNVTTTLSTTLGTFTATAANGAVVVGSGTATLSITDVVADVDATLQSLSFVSAGGGSAAVTVLTSDNGNTGSGGAQSDSDTFTINIDAAPTVNATTPANGATAVAVAANVSVTFSEAVNVAGNWFQIVCPISGTRNFADTVVSGGPASFTINPNADFAQGETCTVTVFAAQVSDQDAIDPPDTMVADFAFSYTTVDAAPTYTGGTASGPIANNATITINFSESVNIAAGGITWACAAGFTPALPQNGVSTITLTPTGALPDGSACDVTLESTLITDADAVDPPNQLDGDNSGDVTDGDADDRVIAFTVDAAPAFVSSTPASGALNFDPTANLTLNFSEPVNATAASFTIDCGAGDLGEVVGGSGSAVITLNPSADLPGGASCTVTGVPLQIDDSDAIDPPANPAPFAFSFTTASLAADDSYSVTPQLTFAANSGTQGEVDANDQLGSGVITGFGPTLGSANGTAPNGTNFITAGGSGGRVVLAADGTFSFFPDAGDAAPLAATFFYTVTGGDTAMVTLTFAAGELVWFVDDNAVGTTCTGNNTGAQACPATTFAAISASDTAGDTLYFADGNHSVTAVLENNERVIGQGSTQSLAVFSGVTPVSGSSFAVLAGPAPVLSSAGVVLTLDATAGNQHRLRGFDIGNSATDIAGLNFGTLDVAEVALTGTGMALNLNNGTLAGGFNGVVSTASSAQGLALQNISVGGTFSFGGTSISGSTTQGLLVSNSPANLDFGATVVNLAGGSDAISLQSSSAGGTRSFSSVTVTNAAGVGLLLFNAGNTNIASGSIATTNRAAIDASGTNALGIALTSVSSTNSTGKGINIDSATGSLSIAGGSISGSSAEAFDLNAGSAVISYAGTIAKTSAGRLVDITNRTAGNVTLSGNLNCTSPCTGINVASNSGGTIAFSAAVKTLNTGTSNAVTLATNGGATINFSGGGLDIDSTSGGGMAVSGGGTVSVQGTGNSIASTTGTALSVVNTAIGAGGLNFQSVSANGATNGIVLSATGASGGLVVTGTGAGGSGGTIQNSVGDAIQLSSTVGPQLSFMNLSNNGTGGAASNAIDQANVSGTVLTSLVISGSLNDAILVNGGTNLTLTNTAVSSSGNLDNEDGMELNNLAGTLNLSGVNFNGAAEELIEINQTTANLAINVSGASQFSYPLGIAPTAGNAILIGATGSGAITFSATGGNTFSNIPLTAVQLGGSAGSTGSHSFTFSGNTISNTIANRAGSVNVQARNNQTIVSTITGNTHTNAGGGVINIGSDETSLHRATVDANTLTAPVSNAILGANDDGNRLRLLVNNNNISSAAADGIEVANFGGVGVSELDTVITNNIVSGHSLNGAVAFLGGIVVFNFEDGGCQAVTGNNVSGNPSPGTYFDAYHEEIGGVHVHEEVPNTGLVTLNAAHLLATNTLAAGGAGTLVVGTIDMSNGVASCDRP